MTVYLEEIDLVEVEKVLRDSYQDLRDQGVTHQALADATGVPVTMFSLWLRGSRRVTKVQMLQQLIDGLPKAELMR